MNTLLVGFDSAWTRGNSGAIAGAVRTTDGTLRDLPAPQVADFDKATEIIGNWESDWSPSATLVLLDQPTIVTKCSRPAAGR